MVYPVYYLLIVLSVNAQRHERANNSTRGLQGDLRGSLPIVALMVGVVALLDDRLGLADAQSPLLMGVVLVATLLVVVSQALATREVIGLHREVATRRFDERLTELVRRSSDMIAICDADGVIRYASPSSEALLGALPNELAGQTSRRGARAREQPRARGLRAGAAHRAFGAGSANFSMPQTGTATSVRSRW